MHEITHRQLRNDSADVLRRAEAGETLVVTNHGRPAAIIGPVPTDHLAALAARGQLRPAIDPPTALRSLRPRAATKTTSEIIADGRGRW